MDFQQQSFRGFTDGQIGIGLLVHLIAITVILLSVGCVDIRDPDSSQPAAPTVSKQASENWDLIVKGTISLDTEADIRKLSAHKKILMKENSVIITHGQHLHLELENLESHNGKIMTFPPGQTAKQNVSGRSGGLIEMKIADGVGTLFFEMRGERGGEGLTYEPNYLDWVGPALGYPGLPGKNGGDSGFLVIEFLGKQNLKILDLHAPGIGGEGGHPGPVNRNGHNNDIIIDGHPVKQGTVGAAGFPGVKGSTCIFENNQRTCTAN